MSAGERSTPAPLEARPVGARIAGGGLALASRRTLPPLAAWRLVRRAYSKRAPATRIHALGRFLTCPYLRTLRHLEPGAHVLDLGAGHGILAVLAVEAGVASVTTVEPDLRKTLSTFLHPRVRALAGRVDTLAGRFDVVTLYDVLYRIPVEERDRLFLAIRDRLRPGGLLLIKEMDPERPLKSAWNRVQEWVSDQFLGLTMGSGFYYEPASEVLARFARCGFLGAEVEDIGKLYPHAHVTYTARLPG